MQQINLYTEIFQARKQYLPLGACLAVCATIVVVGALIAGVQAWSLAQLKKEVAALRGSNEQQEQSLAADQVRLSQRAESTELSTRLEKLRNELASKQKLIQGLQAVGPVERQGYSAILTSLARHPVSGLWLTHIGINQEDVNLTGFTKRSELVPSYIATLVTDNDFGPRGYEAMAIKAVDGGLLSFELRGKVASEKSR